MYARSTCARIAGGAAATMARASAARPPSRRGPPGGVSTLSDGTSSGICAPRSRVPSAATATRAPAPVSAATAGRPTTVIFRPCSRSRSTRTSLTVGNERTASRSAPMRTCSVVMSRAACVSASRTRGASGPPAPDTVTRSTRTSEESRSQRNAPAMRMAARTRPASRRRWAAIRRTSDAGFRRALPNLLRVTRRLAELTTLRLGGPAARFVEARDEDAIVAGVRDAEPPVLVLAGGSNLVVADEGFPGTVVHLLSRGIEPTGHGRVTVQAGEPWDDFVAAAVDRGVAGIECLSGIPGSVGATPIQNVGAYGQDVAETIASVRVHDRHHDETLDLGPEDCGFAYRSSRFKREPGRWVVLSVSFALRPGEESAPIRYAELARTLGVELGDRAPLRSVREAVLALRRGKGMVIDPADPDSISAGSFFTNPILEAGAFEALEARAGERPPAWPEPDGRTKTSAAWLIERAGFTRGYGDPERIAISSKHTLALTNRGAGTARHLVALAREIAGGVRERFGVRLVNEPVLVGLALDEGATEAVDVAGAEGEGDVAAARARR